jgi:hypothetical protein
MKQLTMVILIGLATSCGNDRKITQQEKDEVVLATKAMLQNYFHDIKSSGLSAEFKYLDNSPDFFWTPPGYRVAISYDSVAAILNQQAPLFQSIENVFDTLRVIALSKELAMYSGTLKSKITDTTGHVSQMTLVETVSL